MQLALFFSLLYPAVALPEPGRSGNFRLAPRVGGQQLTNPDNEPAFVHPDGSTEEKSRVLSGLGNPEADNRWFDWDESCSDAGQRQMILSTFTATMELAESGSQHLADLTAKLPNPPKIDKPTKANRDFIWAQDQAFAQMFNCQDQRLGFVKESFDLVLGNGRSFVGRGGGQQPGGLRFICNANNHVMNGAKSAPYCGALTQAIRTVPGSDAIEPKYRFDHATSITFCPTFFDDAAFPNINTVKNNVAQPYLSNVDCRERILLHEYLHVPWVRNMAAITAEKEFTGFFDAANVAKKMTWREVRQNPDNFAWYALYSYFNSHNTGLGCDVWPKGVKKPVTAPT